VGVCTLGLTLVALAMMEIWGKFPPRDLVEMIDLNGGNGIHCQGAVVCPRNFNRS